MIQIFVNLLAVCLTAQIWPLSSQLSNKRTLFDDCILLMIIDCLLCCTAFVAKGTERYTIGFIIVTLTLFCLVVNLYLLLSEFFNGCKLRIRRCCYVRRATKGKTLSFAKKKIGDSLQVKWKKLKNIVTSSDVIKSNSF